MSIGRRLSLAFGGVALVIAAGAAITSWQFLDILHHSRMLAAVDEKLLTVYRVRADVGAIRRRLDAVAKTHDPARFKETARQLRQESFADIEQALTYFNETGTPVPGTLSALRYAMADQFDAMQRLSEVGDWSAILLRLDNQVDALLDAVREMVDHVNSDVSEQRLRSLREIEASERRAQIILTLIGLASLATALVLGVYVTRSIVGPLSKLKAATHQLASGDFDVSIEPGARDELGAVSEAFVAAAGKLHDYYVALKRSNEDLEQFAYVVSHDLQEPLRTVNAFSELLRVRCGDVIPPEGQEYLTFMAEAATRMRQLVTGILEYSRLASSESRFEESVDAEEIVAIALENLHATIEQTGTIVTRDPLPTVMGRRLRLIQLFQNLIGNAIKYRRQGTPPRIHIATRSEGNMWQFCVEDNGIGIDPKYHAQVFGMFKQLNRASQDGIGVGLAISKRIVEQHGGDISIASTLGTGSRFYFTLKKAK